MQAMPALLNTDIHEFIEQFERLSPYYHYFQIDIADGLFVPNKTIQITDLIELFSRSHPEKRFSFDLHLMVDDYKTYAHQAVKLSSFVTIKNILIHHKVMRDRVHLAELTASMPKKFDVGIVLNPEDGINTIVSNYDYLNLPSIQIMTVTPGFQGSPFLLDNINKIEQLRVANYRNTIFVDGGMNDKTIVQVNAYKYRPDYVGVGSYLSNAKDLDLAVKILESSL